MSAGTNKTVVVTGASMGIGRAIAEAFVKAGYHAALCARGERDLERTANELSALAKDGQKLIWTTCDVSDEAQVRALAAKVENEFGGCDVLVNNAGVLGPIGPLETADWPEWKRTIEIDLYGVVIPCRAIIPQMKRKGRGKIINLSGGGATNSRPNFSAYAAAKTAVVRVTEVLADELKAAHIDVNAVAPGPVRTRMTVPALQAEMTEACAPTLAADLCVFLASPECDGITGRLISARWDDWKSLPACRDKITGSDLYTLRRIVPREEHRP